MYNLRNVISVFSKSVALEWEKKSSFIDKVDGKKITYYLISFYDMQRRG